jgi:hypothetical protein
MFESARGVVGQWWSFDRIIIKNNKPFYFFIKFFKKVKIKIILKFYTWDINFLKSSIAKKKHVFIFYI